MFSNQSASVLFLLQGVQWISRKPQKVENKQDGTSICTEISRFTPNMCNYASVLQFCNSFCMTRTHKDNLNCGHKPSHRVRRIVGGQESVQGEWPWHVSLHINGVQWCSGSILSEHYILTAAHCFDPDLTSMEAKDWLVYAGDYQRTFKDPYEQKLEVKKIIIHPQYKGTEKQSGNGLYAACDNDIAILQLKTAVKLNDTNKASICLPDRRKKIPDRYACYIVGWGHTTYNGTQPDKLRQAKVYTVPTSICNLEIAYNNSVNGKNNICAGYAKGGVDACHFDSGGSMVCHKEGYWYATGIVSTGFECARPYTYGLYTNVPEFKKWIVDSILTESIL